MNKKEQINAELDRLYINIKEETERINHLQETKGRDRNGWVDECAERFLTEDKKRVNKLCGLIVYPEVA